MLILAGRRRKGVVVGRHLVWWWCGGILNMFISISGFIKIALLTIIITKHKIDYLGCHFTGAVVVVRGHDVVSSALTTTENSPSPTTVEDGGVC